MKGAYTNYEAEQAAPDTGRGVLSMLALGCRNGLYIVQIGNPEPNPN
jgi:hypothetical protein